MDVPVPVRTFICRTTSSTVASSQIPKQLQTGSKKQAKLFAYPSEEDLKTRNSKNGKYVEDWKLHPVGEWWLTTRDQKEIWIVTIAEKQVADQCAEQAFEKEFDTKMQMAEGNNQHNARVFAAAKIAKKKDNQYTAARVFAAMDKQSQDVFRSLSKEAQIRMLRIPLKKQAGYLRGDYTLDEIIKQNATQPKDRPRPETTKSKELDRYPQPTKSKKVTDDMVPIYAFHSLVNPNVIKLFTPPPPHGGIKLSMRVKQSEHRKMNKTLEEINGDTMTFPRQIKEIIYKWWVLKCISRWLEDLPLAADECTDASPGLFTMMMLRRLDPQMYLKALYKSKLERGLCRPKEMPFMYLNAETALYIYKHFTTAFFAFDLDLIWKTEYTNGSGLKMVQII